MNKNPAKVSNIILRVGSLERSLEFYRDSLSLTVLGASEAFAFLDGGGVTLALNAVGKDIETNPPGLTEVVFEVDDVEASFKAFSAAGVEFRNTPRVVMGNEARELLAADFRDPDGNVLSITGWRQVDSQRHYSTDS